MCESPGFPQAAPFPSRRASPNPQSIAATLHHISNTKHHTGFITQETNIACHFHSQKMKITVRNISFGLWHKSNKNSLNPSPWNWNPGITFTSKPSSEHEPTVTMDQCSVILVSLSCKMTAWLPLGGKLSTRAFLVN